MIKLKNRRLKRKICSSFIAILDMTENLSQL